MKAKNLRVNGQSSVHMQTETRSRQTKIATDISAFNVSATLFNVRRTGITDLSARAAAMETLVTNSWILDVQLITFDTSNSIQQDRRSIAEAAKRSGVTVPHYRHMNARHEPLLWIPDIIAWCYGRGGTWREAVEPLVEEVIEL